MLIQSSSHLSLEQNALIVGDSISQLYDFKSMEPTGYMLTFALSVVQSLSCAQMFATTRTATSQSSLSFTIPQSLLKLRSIELVMPANHTKHWTEWKSPYPSQRGGADTGSGGSQRVWAPSLSSLQWLSERAWSSLSADLSVVQGGDFRDRIQCSSRMQELPPCWCFPSKAHSAGGWWHLEGRHSFPKFQWMLPPSLY